MREKSDWESFEMKRILGRLYTIYGCVKCFWTRRVRDFFNLVLMLSLSLRNAFQLRETGGAISASQTWIRSNGITSEIVRQIVDTCEGVRNAGDSWCNDNDCVCTCTVCEMERKRGKKRDSHSTQLQLKCEWVWKGKRCRWLPAFLIDQKLDLTREKKKNIWKNN